MTLEAFSAPGRIPYVEAVRADYQPTTVGTHWGPVWSTHWFRVTLEVPQEWHAHEVHFLWDSSSEACVWLGGTPVQGLTGSYSGWQSAPIRAEFPLKAAGSKDSPTQLYVEIACNGLFGELNIFEPQDGTYQRQIGHLVQAEVAVFDRLAWDLAWDLQVVADLASELSANTPQAGQALWTANAMVNAILLDDRTTWEPARALARTLLSQSAGRGAHELSAIGHCHIDTAWLWPLAESRRKCLRSFSTAVQMMDEYPEYKFACSQAQQLAWVKEDAPQLFRRIQEKAASGQFFPVGGTWVEPDCNLPSGESLVRQFLLGQRFFEREFGQPSRVFWNPDVFGYSAALPQIMKLAGITGFLTQKLSWNQVNKPRSHTFLWEGLDGSTILTHFPPADTYNSLATVKELLFNVSNFKDHDRARESLLLFGYGDGGGGPTRGMLEQLRRVQDVDGLPRVTIRSPEGFFDRCGADIKAPTRMVGELYFELHRGTYTSQARTKRGNLLAETGLNNTEFFASLAHALGRFEYPAVELEQLWQTVLTHQFHDILPGSSTALVHSEAETVHQHVNQRVDILATRLLASLEEPPTKDEPLRTCVWNTLWFDRTVLVDSRGTGELGYHHVPALGFSVSDPSPAPAQNVRFANLPQGGFCLENAALLAEFDGSGRLTRLFSHLAQREALPTGETGGFVLYEDRPNNYDAWDLDVFYREKTLDEIRFVGLQVVEQGPLRVTVSLQFSVGSHSMLEQRVSLEALGERLEFHHKVDWAERHKVLRVEFPLAIRAFEAHYEVQHGHVARPTHENTSYDWARFEVPHQRWALLADSAFGVALLNDGKYGASCRTNVLGLSLLRSPTYPDPECDQGGQEFAFALLPQAGTADLRPVVQQAKDFAVPVLVSTRQASSTHRSFLRLAEGCFVVDAVKKAEDGSDLIVRIYEPLGVPSTCRLETLLSLACVTEVNLLERFLADCRSETTGWTFSLRPFELKTFRLRLANFSASISSDSRQKPQANRPSSPLLL